MSISPCRKDKEKLKKLRKEITFMLFQNYWENPKWKNEELVSKIAVKKKICFTNISVKLHFKVLKDGEKNRERIAVSTCITIARWQLETTAWVGRKLYPFIRAFYQFGNWRASACLDQFCRIPTKFRVFSRQASSLVTQTFFFPLPPISPLPPSLFLNLI